MLPEQTQPPQKLSRARGCLGVALLSLGLLTLISGASMLATNNSSYWAYDFEVTRSANGGGTSSSFHGGMNIDPLTITVVLMAGAAMLAGCVFVYRRNFSLRFLLVSVFAIGFIGMIPGKYAKTPLARMSMKCMFGKQVFLYPFNQIDQIELAMDPRYALKTLPEQMQSELQLTPSTRVGNHSVALVSNDPIDQVQGAVLNIEFSPDLTTEQREALTEFYAYYFEQLCFEYAKSAGAINDTTSTRPTVNNRFYKYLKEWEDKRTSTR